MSGIIFWAMLIWIALAFGFWPVAGVLAACLLLCLALNVNPHAP